MATTAVDCLMENLKGLMDYQTGLIPECRGEIEFLYKDFALLRTFLEDCEQEHSSHQKVSNLVTRVRDVANKAEDTIDLFVVSSVLKSITLQEKEIDMEDEIHEDSDHSLNLSDVREEMEAIKAEIVGIHNESSDILAVKDDKFHNGAFPIPNSTAWEDKVMVGFEDEMVTLKDQLTGVKKQLDVISIVGMPGLGKTTLARKVYNDPLITYHFHIKAWVHVSQKYQKREVLLGLCIHVSDDANQPKNDLEDLADERLRDASRRSNDLLDMTDEQLSEELRKSLKGKRYLVVMDDIWDFRVWEDLRSSLPNDNNGSRIILTSRFTDVVLQAKPSNPPLFLRLFSEGESWDLFQQTVFRGRTCPEELLTRGMQLAKSCKGLPLMIVVVGGVLENTERSEEEWEKIEEILNLRVVSSLQLCMETVALSYDHLPNHLRPCFLYFAAFPENYEIPVWKLTWLWVSEGFIQKIGEKSLEDVAEEYLMDLIRRNLILVSGRRSDGGVKTCGMHDLLRSFCFLKAEEENFLQKTFDDDIFSTKSTLNNNSRMRRICISSRPLCTHRRTLWDTSVIPSGLSTRSFLCFGHIDFSHHQFLSRCFKLLRVLHISSTDSVYPREVERLVLLRYLAISGVYADSRIHLPASISNFWNLKTLILEKFQNVTLPESILKMSKLRHIRLSGPGIHEIERQDTDAQYSSSLDHLQTLSLVNPWSCCDLLSVAPNLRKLGFRGDIVSWGRLSLPQIHLPIHLQKLKLYNTYEGKFYWSTNFRRIVFPPNLKKLTYRNTNLLWKDMVILATMLPNLEVVKLLGRACSGFYWKTSRVFPKLKFLLLREVPIMQWEVSSNHFPVLQQLVLSRCFNLRKIPSEVGDIPTLNMIEVNKCRSAESSARKIKDEQESIGNNWLQVMIN